MKHFFELIYRPVKRIIEYGFRRKYHYQIPFLTKIKYAILGFTSDQYVYYDFANNSYKEYLSEYERMKTFRINGNFGTILNNKLIFEEIAGKYTRVPVNYAYIKDGNIYGLKNYYINNKNVIEFVKEKNICTLKLQGG